MKTTRCGMCEERTRACGSYCRSCQSARHHAIKRIEAEGLLVDEAGGSWWVWTAKGEVLVIGKDTKVDAINALASGDLAEAS